jgi:hypothetical protein
MNLGRVPTSVGPFSGSSLEARCSQDSVGEPRCMDFPASGLYSRCSPPIRLLATYSHLFQRFLCALERRSSIFSRKRCSWVHDIGVVFTGHWLLQRDHWLLQIEITSRFETCQADAPESYITMNYKYRIDSRPVHDSTSLPFSTFSKSSLSGVQPCGKCTSFVFAC